MAQELYEATDDFSSDDSDNSDNDSGISNDDDDDDDDTVSTTSSASSSSYSSYSDEDNDDNEWTEPATLHEKRGLYLCGDSYVQLNAIDTWPQYALKRRLTRLLHGTHDSSSVHQSNRAINDKISLFRGDSTTLEVDAIVNAAKESLLGGGGIDGAIHRAAGPMLLRECKTLGGCETGKTKMTRGYRLPAKYVLHTVGPRGEKPHLLKSCYETCLDLVEENGIRSVAFCCISTGIYGYPLVNASKIAIGTVREWLEKNHDKVDRIIFVVFLEREQQVYEELLSQYFPLSTNDGAMEGEEENEIDVGGDDEDDDEGDDEDEHDEDNDSGEDSDDEDADEELLRIMVEEEQKAAEEEQVEEDEHPASDDDDKSEGEERDNDGDDGMDDEETTSLMDTTTTPMVDRKEGNVWLMSDTKVEIERASLSPRIIEALKSMGIAELFSVQRAVVPVTIAMAKSGTPGDICIGSPTGSGKTLAYVLPIQELLLRYRNRALRSIIVVPTSTLANQVLSVFKQFEPSTGIKACVVSGVIHQDIEVKSLIETTVVDNRPRHRILADVVIGTPAPILAHMKSTPGFSVDHLELMVFDEVDSLLQSDMIGMTRKIVENYYGSASVVSRQKRARSTDVPFPAPLGLVRKIVCSATLGTNPSKFDQLKLFRPQFFTRAAVTGIRPKKYVLPPQLQQNVITYIPTFKPLYFIYMMKDIVADDQAKILCFTNTNLSAQRLYEYLKHIGHTKMALFTRVMSKKDQKNILSAFANGDTNLLISSDSIARGMDFHVDIVVNYELPKSLKIYVHRVGRTARADREGHAFNFVLESEFPRLNAMLEKVDCSELRDLSVSSRDIEIYKEDFMEYLRNTFSRQKRDQRLKKALDPARVMAEKVLRQLSRE